MQALHNAVICQDNTYNGHTYLCTHMHLTLGGETRCRVLPECRLPTIDLRWLKPGPVLLLILVPGDIPRVDIKLPQLGVELTCQEYIFRNCIVASFSRTWIEPSLTNDIVADPRTRIEYNIRTPLVCILIMLRRRLQ